MNTVHRSPSLQGAVERNALSANSSLMLMPRRSACSSRNEPVPAAQALFISKSTTAPFRRLINLASCPPISNIVSTDGSITAAATAWAVISFRTTSAPIMSPVRYLPEPVVPEPTIFTREPISSPTSARPCFTASIGLPAVGRYRFESTRICRSMTTTFVDTDPTSTPRKASMRDSLLPLPHDHERRAHGAGSIEVLGHKEVPVREPQHILERPPHPEVRGHAAEEQERRNNFFALPDRGLEVPGHGITEACHDVVIRRGDLLQMDHVALREHAAPARDARRVL